MQFTYTQRHSQETNTRLAIHCIPCFPHVPEGSVPC
jgi:hypothetical protein